jgi:hypothetical protein
VARAPENPGDRKIFQAFQKAGVKGLKLQAVDPSYFKELRERIATARKFDGLTATNESGLRSAGGP